MAGCCGRSSEGGCSSSGPSRAGVSTILVARLRRPQRSVHNWHGVCDGLERGAKAIPATLRRTSFQALRRNNMSYPLSNVVHNDRQVSPPGVRLRVTGRRLPSSQTTVAVVNGDRPILVGKPTSRATVTSPGDPDVRKKAPERRFRSQTGVQPSCLGRLITVSQPGRVPALLGLGLFRCHEEVVVIAIKM
jgi:hypothetical protein